MRIRQFLLRTLAAIGLSAAVVAQAQTTRIVVPFPAGGGTDQYARLLANELGKRGMTVIVDNKPGASGILAADFVARSKPDGQTLLMSSLSTLANNTVLYDKLPYDPNKDFTAVTHIAYQPSILVGRADLPYKDVREMVAFAKANPGKINRGSPGAAILTNLAPMKFEQMAGVQITHIPFAGDAPGIQALLSGTIDVHGTSITGPLAHIRSGKLRVLGVMDTQRMSQVPEAPTFKELGFDVVAQLWYALSAPANTPRETVMALNQRINQVLVDPEFVARARAIGMEPRGGTPEQLTAFIREEAQRWVPMLESLKLPRDTFK
ncbi:MAG: hypothetical protein RIQ97_640 [Pseudomonadota bacterium]|jgi:tripartite-type tricarboxylate transporter receptor subunit TctC